MKSSPSPVAALPTAVLLALIFTTARGANTMTSRTMPPDISLLADSPLHPLPTAAVDVPEITSAAEVHDIEDHATEPYMFMIYQSSGPHATEQAAKLYFFRALSLEYLGGATVPDNLAANARPAVAPGRKWLPTVHFRTVSEDTSRAAADALFTTNAAKPVYIVFNPAYSEKEPTLRWGVFDESQGSDTFTQVVAENSIKANTKIWPTYLYPGLLTEANQLQKLALVGDASMLVLYAPRASVYQAMVNRVATLFAAIQYSYVQEENLVFKEIQADEAVFRSLIGSKTGAQPPTGPEIWLLTPGAKPILYKPAEGGHGFADLTDEDLEDWLDGKHFPKPAKPADAEALSRLALSARTAQDQGR